MEGWEEQGLVDSKTHLDWDLIRHFLAVARSGSLSLAASSLGCSQPTVSRNLQALEERYGVGLFHRSQAGSVLTEAGVALFRHAENMEHQAFSCERLLGGQHIEEPGTLRLSVNELLGFYDMPSLISNFRHQHKEVQIELVVTDKSSALDRLEADVALRMFKPKQLDLVSSLLAEFSMGIFVHKRCLEGLDEIKSLESFWQHVQSGRLPMIGDDSQTRLIDGLRSTCNIEAVPDDFVIRCDHTLVSMQLLAKGVGALIAQTRLASVLPDVVQLLPNLSLPKLPLYLVYHNDLRRLARLQSFVSAVKSHFLSQ